MLAESVRFESIRPRDLELLVCEELAVSPTFLSWLCESLGVETHEPSLVHARDAVDCKAADTVPSGVECGLEVGGERHSFSSR
ncbi:hypothetical protein [Natronorubrum sp. FCH18a]|uniref:hypothetical protein n=1 Tax=Natronorubrum sp. FCH18a TaxID=3447018 RepID=UPI003F5166B2